MERVVENQKCIKVSLARVYNGSLVLKTEDKSLSKTVNFKRQQFKPPPSINVELTLSVAQ